MMNGTSEIKVNDLGTTELHKKHRVTLEQSDGAFLRAKVSDQIYIDKLLIDKVISLSQHATAEWFLNQAVKANIYVRTPFMGARSSGAKASDKYTNNLLVFSRTMRKVTRKFGAKGSQILFQAVVDNLKIQSAKKMETFKNILDYLGKKKSWKDRCDSD